MASMKSQKFQTVCTVLGSMLMVMPGSCFAYWGNISVYVSSFIFCRLSDNSSVDGAWVISLFNIAWGLTFMATGPFSKYVPAKYSIALGIAMVCTAMFVSYFTVQMSWTMLNASLGVLVGAGQGIIQAIGIEVVFQAATDNAGFLSSLYLAATSVGGVIMSQAGTWFVNLHNESPDMNVGENRYFTQMAILDKVPSMFLLYGAISSGIYLLGLIILQGNPRLSFVNWNIQFATAPENVPLTAKCNRSDSHKKSNNNDNKCNVCLGGKFDTDIKTSADTIPYDEKSKDLNGEGTNHFTPKQMLKTPLFYALWASHFISGISYIVILNLYKVYGQVWIRDDHFLTFLGTSSFILVIFGRVAWGWVFDKIGPKHCLMILTSVTVMTSCSYYFTAMISRWLYFLATLLYGLVTGCTYSCYFTCVGVMFGKKHVTINSGLLLTSDLIANLWCPYLLNVVLTNFGYFTAFAGSGALNIICVLLCIFFFPQNS